MHSAPSRVSPTPQTITQAPLIGENPALQVHLFVVKSHEADTRLLQALEFVGLLQSLPTVALNKTDYLNINLLHNLPPVSNTNRKMQITPRGIKISDLAQNGQTEGIKY